MFFPPRLGGYCFAFSFFLFHSCLVCVLYVIRKLGVLYFLSSLVFQMSLFTFIFWGSQSRAVRCDGGGSENTGEILRSSPTKKTNKKNTCSVLWSHSKTKLWYYSPSKLTFITIDADLFSSATLSMPHCLPLSPGTSRSNRRLPNTACPYEKSRHKWDDAASDASAPPGWDQTLFKSTQMGPLACAASGPYYRTAYFKSNTGIDGML